MRGCVAILFSLIMALVGHIAPAAGDDLGVVLLHGKGGSPSGYVRELAFALQSKGHLVSAPTMPWAQNRIYDASFDEAMYEIDRAIDSLRQKGAKFVVVAGHSLGANAALCGRKVQQERGQFLTLHLLRDRLAMWLVRYAWSLPGRCIT